jgi:hypothetical protein
MEILFSRCCGLDVHKSTITACVRIQEAAGKPRKIVGELRAEACRGRSQRSFRRDFPSGGEDTVVTDLIADVDTNDLNTPWRLCDLRLFPLRFGIAILFQGRSPFCTIECVDLIEAIHKPSIIDRPSSSITVCISASPVSRSKLPTPCCNKPTMSASGRIIWMLGFFSEAIPRNCCTARCCSIWYCFFKRLSPFFLAEKLPSAYYADG